jgi:hypothetical protein
VSYRGSDSKDAAAAVDDNVDDAATVEEYRREATQGGEL